MKRRLYGRCAYCGEPTRRCIDYTCVKCADLPARDPEVQARRYRHWWLERYTPAEIAVLAHSWAAGIPSKVGRRAPLETVGSLSKSPAGLTSSEVESVVATNRGKRGLNA